MKNDEYKYVDSKTASEIMAKLVKSLKSKSKYTKKITIEQIGQLAARNSHLIPEAMVLLIKESKDICESKGMGWEIKYAAKCAIRYIDDVNEVVNMKLDEI